MWILLIFEIENVAKETKGLILQMYPEFNLSGIAQRKNQYLRHETTGGNSPGHYQ